MYEANCINLYPICVTYVNVTVMTVITVIAGLHHNDLLPTVTVRYAAFDGFFVGGGISRHHHNLAHESLLQVHL